MNKLQYTHILIKDKFGLKKMGRKRKNHRPPLFEIFLFFIGIVP